MTDEEFQSIKYSDIIQYVTPSNGLTDFRIDGIWKDYEEIKIMEVKAIPLNVPPPHCWKIYEFREDQIRLLSIKPKSRLELIEE